MTENKMNHSLSQHKLFFALVVELGLSKEEAIERAKKRYNVEHFAELKPEQMAALIDALHKKVEEQTPPELKLPLRFRAVYSNEGTPAMYFFSLFDVRVDGAGKSIIVSEEGKTVFLDEADAIMQFTGKKDYFRQEIFHFDIILDRRKNKWVVQWGEKDLAWIATNMHTNETKLLATFSAVKIIGDMYRGITEDE